MAQETFAARLKYWRQLRGLSQRALAEISGVDAGFIGRIERDPKHEPRSETKRRLAKGLRIEPYLLEAEETRAPTTRDQWAATEEQLRKLLANNPPEDITFIMRQIRHMALQGAVEPPKPRRGKKHP